MHGIIVPVCTRRYMCMRVCNQSRFGTLQEVINSQDYCADTMISKVLHNSLCGKGWLNQSTWKGERDVRFAASCRGPSASLSAPAVSLLCKEEGVWTSKNSHATLETETISKGSGERWQRGEPCSMIPKKIYSGIAGEKRATLYSKDCTLQRGNVDESHILEGQNTSFSHFPSSYYNVNCIILNWPRLGNQQITPLTVISIFSLTLVSCCISTAAWLESRRNLRGTVPHIEHPWAVLQLSTIS